MDDALVTRAREGDRAAMQELLESIAPTIHRFAMRMCRNEADADDVVQDALLSIAQNLRSFEGRSSLPSWTFTLARTACSRKRRGLANQPMENDSTLETRPSDRKDPEEHAAEQETSALVAHALDVLPEAHREVLLLRDAEGLTAPEAALVLGVSVDAVKSRLHRARSALRDVLRPVLERDVRPTGSCPDVVTALSRKLEDDLDPTACAEMEKHVEGCPACARTCDALKDALAACRASPSPKLTPALEKQVRGAIQRWLAAPG